MMPRGTIIAALLVIELAIMGETLVALRGSQPAEFSMQRLQAQRATFDPRLVEDGPHEIFVAGAHPTLTVDIGYADLTIITSETSQIDVSVSASTAFGVFRATDPITARQDSAAIRIATSGGPGWAIGDDRRVTVLVPPQTQVTVIKAGDIDATGLRAEASFKSIGRGSVRVENYDAPALQVEASGGRITLHEIVAGRLDATDGNGRVEGTALQVRNGSVQSNGRVTLGFATGADTLVSAQTSNGIVSVSGLTPVTSGSKNDDQNDASSQTVRIGAGNGRLDVHSSDGNIRLAQDG